MPLIGAEEAAMGPRELGRSKRKKVSGSDVTALPMVASQRQQQPLQLSKALSVADTLGRGGDVVPSWSQQVQGKTDAHRGTGNNSSGTIRHHLPTITRGPEALRQQIRQNHGNSPLQRTPGNQATVSKIEYLSRIATWAATTKIASLGAFYGERLATACQSAGIPSPVLNSQCERCESVLLPGVNCSVRGAPKKKKETWRKGTDREAISTAANTVVHRCHYCKYGNWKPGTPKQDMKTKLAEVAARAQMKDLASSSQPLATADPITPAHTQRVMKASADGALSIPVTPPGSQPAVLSPANALQVDHSAGSSSNKKRKRKGWTGLKAISTPLQNGELATPEKLGFAVDFTSPLNPRKKGSI